MSDVGRPSKFNEAVKEKMLALFEQGRTNKEVAEVIGVHVRTIENWQAKHPEFLWALREAKQIADDLIEASLFSRAAGYSHEEEKIFFDSKTSEVVTHKTVKHYPPDTQAALNWLQCRRPNQWREKKTLVHEGGDKPIQVKQVDLEERIRLLEESENK